MFCSNCGAEIKPEEKFCKECGAKISYQDNAQNNTQRRYINNSIDLQRSIKNAMHGDPESLIDTVSSIPQSVNDAMHGNTENLKDIILETQRLRNKIDYVDDNSKPLQKFLMVEIIIMVIMIIVGICLKNMSTVIFSSFGMLVAVLMFFGNKSKGNSFIKFKVGRNMVPILIMMTVMVIGITIMTASVGMTLWPGEEDEFFNSDFAEETEIEETTGIAGTYRCIYEEEIEGDKVEVVNTIVLNEDHTCEVTFQDTIQGKWQDGHIILDDGSDFEFEVHGDSLLVHMFGEWIEYR